LQFLFARGELTTQDNQWECSRTLASDLGFSSGTEFFQVLATSDPFVLRNKYQVVYIAPGISSSDYTYLQRMVGQGGLIDQFVSLGGVAVINVAGLPLPAPPADPGQVAPGGVTLATTTAHSSEDITAPDHPYISGLGFGGRPLVTADFDNWGPTQPTDLGTLDLTHLAATPTTVLGHGGDQPTWVEYRHGDGRVIVTTLSYCWAADPSVLTPSQRAATTNLLRYSSFFSGSAFTPAPTVTATGSPTPTFTPRFRTPTLTSTPVRTNSPTPTPTATPVVTLADVIGAIFGDSTPAGADANQDGSVTAADVPALIQLLQ
jgi:hypothetical protein